MSPNALERNAWEMRCNSRKWLKKQMPIARSRGCGMEARVGGLSAIANLGLSETSIRQVNATK